MAHTHKQTFCVIVYGRRSNLFPLTRNKKGRYRRGRALLNEGVTQKNKTLYCSSFNFVEESKTLMRFSNNTPKTCINTRNAL